MNTRALLFPGQGAQFEGMGRDWAESFPEAAQTWREADATLGFSLSAACWNSGDEVNRTDIAQPGIFTTSVAILRVLMARGLDLSQAPFAAGLSLGEYTALWAAGVMRFEDGLRLVRLRGEAMQDAAEAIPSGMISLMGAEEAQAQSLADAAAAVGICQVANLNAPGQIILSGENKALDEVERIAKDHGVRRTRRLVVAGGFHSECMRPASDRLRAALAETPFATAKIPVVSNVTAAPCSDADTLKEQLAVQVCAPVRWEQSMRWAMQHGGCGGRFLEPGPGSVLAGLFKKIDPEADVMGVERPEQVSAAQA
ncbi:MAG: ACP S-malonyltransferase [Planctomycetota bacterium]